MYWGPGNPSDIRWLSVAQRRQFSAEARRATVGLRGAERAFEARRVLDKWNPIIDAEGPFQAARERTGLRIEFGLLNQFAAPAAAPPAPPPPSPVTPPPPPPPPPPIIQPPPGGGGSVISGAIGIPVDIRDDLIIESSTDDGNFVIDVIVRVSTAEFTAPEIDDPTISPRERRRRASARCIQDMVFSHRTVDFVASTVSRHKIGTANIIGVSVVSQVTNPDIGNTFVKVFLTRDTVNNKFPSYVLVSGYLDQGVSLSWPQSILRNAREGPRFTEADTSSDPIAGAQPADFPEIASAPRVLVVSQITLVTDATIANRRVRLRWKPTGASGVDFRALSVQTASQTIIYQACVDIESREIAGEWSVLSIPRIMMRANTGDWQWFADNIQGGDDFSASFNLMEFSRSF